MIRKIIYLLNKNNQWKVVCLKIILLLLQTKEKQTFSCITMLNFL